MKHQIHRNIAAIQSTAADMAAQLGRMPNNEQAAVPYAQTLLTQVHELERSIRGLRRHLQPLAGVKCEHVWGTVHYHRNNEDLCIVCGQLAATAVDCSCRHHSGVR